MGSAADCAKVLQGGNVFESFMDSKLKVEAAKTFKEAHEQQDQCTVRMLNLSYAVQVHELQAHVE